MRLIFIMFILLIQTIHVFAQEVQTINVELKNLSFMQGDEINAPLKLEVGQTYTLIFTNNDVMDHEVVFGKDAIKNSSGLSTGYKTNLFSNLEVDIEGIGKINDYVEQELKVGKQLILTVTIPEDLKGEWELGCFVPGHYEAGMKAPVSIQ